MQSYNSSSERDRLVVVASTKSVKLSSPSKLEICARKSGLSTGSVLRYKTLRPVALELGDADGSSKEDGEIVGRGVGGGRALGGKLLGGGVGKDTGLKGAAFVSEGAKVDEGDGALETGVSVMVGLSFGEVVG